MFRFESIDGQRPSRLAEQTSVTKQSVNDLLRDLERLGCIVLRPDPDDRRARVVQLTARGRQLDAAVRPEARKTEREMKDVLGAARFAALRQALLDVTASLDSEAVVGNARALEFSRPRGARRWTGPRGRLAGR